MFLTCSVNMHEFSTMAQIVDVVLEEVKKHSVTDVKEVHLEIGELTLFGREQMEFAYEVLSRNSILERSELIIEEKKAMVSCNSCDYEGEIDYEKDLSLHIFPKLTCPACGASVKIVGGNECKIKNIVVEVEG